MCVETPQDVLGPWDKGTGNVIVNGKYTPIDFEHCVHDSLAAIVGERTMLAGVDSVKMEKVARGVVCRLESLGVDGAYVGDLDEFERTAKRLQSRQLLRVANRYSRLAEVVTNKDEMGELSRFFRKEFYRTGRRLEWGYKRVSC